MTSAILFGSGNGNGGFTVNRDNGVELGLRAKVRYPTPLDVYNSNGDGTYDQLAGNNGSGRALWDFEWSVNSDMMAPTGKHLSGHTYVLRIDQRTPTAGDNIISSFDPINGINPGSGTILWDHGIGKTLRRAEPEITMLVAQRRPMLVFLANNNVAQNSWFIGWYAPFDSRTLTAQLLSNWKHLTALLHWALPR